MNKIDRPTEMHITLVHQRLDYQSLKPDFRQRFLILNEFKRQDMITLGNYDHVGGGDGITQLVWNQDL